MSTEVTHERRCYAHAHDCCRVAEYLIWESAQPEKHECVAGEIFAKTGVRLNHNLIAGNAFLFLKQAPSDLADGTALSVHQPWLIVEVLSDSTAANDRGKKFEHYRQIASLTH